MRADRIFVSISVPVENLHLGEKDYCVAVLRLSFSSRIATVFNGLLDVAPNIRCIISVQVYNFLSADSTFILFRGLFAGLLCRCLGVIFTVKLIKTGSRVETLFRNAVKILLVS
jgi:hypothetical protein